METLYLLLIPMALSMSITKAGHGSGELCSDELRYHEVCFLTSHNSYAAHGHDFFYAQQAGTLAEQLNQGVRGFMLDTHLDRQGEVALCHRNERITRLIRRGKPPLLFSDELKTLGRFLRENPTEILTIFLENYVHNKELLDNAFKMAEIDDYILTPSLWNPVEREGWPTLTWMRHYNKRLIIFNSLGQTNLTYNQWEHIVENQWGTLLCRRACTERRESLTYRSHKRYLYLLNFFPSFRLNRGGSYCFINTSKLDRFLAQVRNGLTDGYAQNRLPNFISIDFVNEGTPMKHVIANNAYPYEKKQLLFRPLGPHES